MVATAAAATLLVAGAAGASATTPPGQRSGARSLNAGASTPTLYAQGLVPRSFRGVPVGGLSGITYDAARPVHHAISDDRGDKAPARLYTLRAELDVEGAPRVAVVSSTTLTDPAGEPLAPGVTDTEGIAMTQRGTLVITSEGDAEQLIPPFVREFSLAGRQPRDLAIPADLVPAPDGTSGIRDNLTLESATVTPSGGGLTGTEGSLVQDGPVSTATAGSTDRVVRYDAAGRPAAQHSYPLGPVPDAPVPADAFAVKGLVELAATGEDTAHALERSFSTGVGDAISLYRVDLTGATEQSRGLLALPPALRRRCGLDRPGAQVEVVERGDGVLEVRPTLAVPADQAWSWTERWQAGEREVDGHLKAGEVSHHGSDEAFAAHLEELDAIADDRQGHGDGAGASDDGPASTSRTWSTGRPRGSTVSFASPDGRATSEPLTVTGETTVRWRRVGDHGAYRQP